MKYMTVGVAGLVGSFMLLGHRNLAADWPAWRGGDAQGVVTDKPMPVEWSSKQTVHWKVSVLGEGHSSPIFYKGSIYLTTAYPTRESDWLGKTISWALLTLVALLAGVTIATHTSTSGAESAKQPTVLWRCASAGTTAWLVTLTVFGNHLFDLAHCDIRSWIASIGFATLCLVEAVLHGRPLVASRRGLGWLALGLAVVTVFGMPHKDHAFRGGLLTNSSLIVWISAGIPLCLSVYWLLLAPSPFCVRLDVSRHPIAIRVTSVFLVALTAGGVTGGFVQCAISASYYADSNEPMEFMGWPWLLLASGALLVSVAICHRKPSWLLPRLVLVGAGGALAVAAGMKLLEHLTNVSSYFRYHIGTPRWQPAYPEWALMAATAVAMVVAASLTACRGLAPRLPGAHSRVVPGLAVLAAGLALGGTMIEREERHHNVWTFAILCLDDQTGETRWVVEGMTGLRPQLDRRNSPSSPTPAGDGDKVVGYFGPAGLFCVNTAGRVLWRTQVARYETFYGAAASPVIADGVVIVAALNPGPEASVWAFDLETGTVLWKRPWPGNFWPLSGNNRTPLIRTLGGRKQVIIWGSQTVRAFDLQTGAEAWSYNLPTDWESGDQVASMVADQHQLYLPGMQETIALSLEALAVGRDPIRWRARRAGANCASPLLLGEKLFLISDMGIAVCLEAKTGQVLVRKRLQGFYMASPIASGGHVYFTNTSGCTTLLGADSQMEKAAINELGENVIASPACADGHLYMRTIGTLYRIGPAAP